MAKPTSSGSSSGTVPTRIGSMIVGRARWRERFGSRKMRLSRSVEFRSDTASEPRSSPAFASVLPFLQPRHARLSPRMLPRQDTDSDVPDGRCSSQGARIPTTDIHPRCNAFKCLERRSNGRQGLRLQSGEAMHPHRELSKKLMVTSCWTVNAAFPRQFGWQTCDRFQPRWPSWSSQTLSRRSVNNLKLSLIFRVFLGLFEPPAHASFGVVCSTVSQERFEERLGRS